jgi:type VI secretion system protein ImpJ
MRQMQRVLWTKGVLLSPQHLQTQDRFFEDLIGFQLSGLTPYPWGFAALELDHEALAGGTLAVSAAAGILQDGLFFDMPQADTPPPPKPLEGLWEPDQDVMNAYLAIPEYQLGGTNVSTAHQQQDTRYVAEVLLRRDENTGLSEKPIQVARKNFRLLVDGESLEGHTTLPIARIQQTESGDLQFDPHFVPPLIEIGASEAVMSVARRLVEVLSARSNELSRMRRQRGQSLAEFGISDVANFWLLYTVNTHLPLIRHVFDTRRGHPGELFAAMLALAGALTTFSETTSQFDLPKYDHLDLAGCFRRLDERIMDLLATVVPTSYVSLPLRSVEPTKYATAIDQDRYLAAPHYFLAVNADMDQGDLIDDAPKLMKISSADGLDRLYKRGLPGVRLTHVPTPPSTIPVKLDYQYFSLDRSGEDWKDIVRARNLAVYVPAEIPNPRLELVIVLPTAEE